MGNFPITSISVNSSYAARRHRDRQNSGPSVIKAFSNFKGGDLRYWPEDVCTGSVDDLCTSKSIVLKVKSATAFDGKHAHEVMPYTGSERFRLVFFTCGKYWKANEEAQQMGTDLGFTWPTESSLNQAMSSVAPAEIRKR